jgi:hypothetical protein
MMKVNKLIDQLIKDIVLIAVRKNGLSLISASERLRDSEKIVMVAIYSNPLGI